MPDHATRLREALAGLAMDLIGLAAIVLFVVGVGMLAGGIAS